LKKRLFAVAAVLALTGAGIALAQNNNGNADQFKHFAPGQLVVTRSVYTGTASTINIGDPLPPVCGTAATCTGKAEYNGSYPNVWFNSKDDGNFGITSPIFLDVITPSGKLVDTLAFPTDQLTTSFSSKSELALNLSPDRKYLTFVGYVAAPNTLDVSNSNTPGIIDPTDPVGSAYYRGIAQIDGSGHITVTRTNAFTGDNGRAAIYAGGALYAVGNSNSGTGTPDDVVQATGVEFITPGQAPGTPQQIGDFNIKQVIDPSTGTYYTRVDKPGKDTNYRGLTVFDNTLYITKGSGSNGINTVYQVGDAGVLPTPQNAPNGDLSQVPTTILPGFPTTLARSKTDDVMYPFGIWFANANTLYVADEGDGNASDASTDPDAGLQKWTKANGVWHRDYVLQTGLELGQTYVVDNYPADLYPATDGLRNLTGRDNGDGTVTIWAVTSTVSANGDQGADPNKLVSITDVVSNTDPGVAATESFTTVRSAASGELLRGVAFGPIPGAN
jgi:hypothetical protein